MKSGILTLAALFTLLALLSSTAIVFADSPSQPKMVGSQWAVYEETTLANGGLNYYPASHASTISTGGVEFQIPDATGSSPSYVNLLLDSFTTSLTESNTISATMNVATTSSTTSFVGNPDGGCPGASASLCPGAVRLFIQANLAQNNTAFCLGGANDNVNNYWWADVSAYSLVTGGSSSTITMSVPLNPGSWSNICGQSGINNPGFDLALANIKEVGLSFGSGYFFSNGLGVDGTTGSATFQLLSYTIL